MVGSQRSPRVRPGHRGPRKNQPEPLEAGHCPGPEITFPNTETMTWGIERIHPADLTVALPKRHRSDYKPAFRPEHRALRPTRRVDNPQGSSPEIEPRTRSFSDRSSSSSWIAPSIGSLEA